MSKANELEVGALTTGGVWVRRAGIDGQKRGLKIENISIADFEAARQKWQGGALIQDAFPMLDADQREFLLTGITPDEWDAMFSDDEGEA